MPNSATASPTDTTLSLNLAPMAEFAEQSEAAQMLLLALAVSPAGLDRQDLLSVLLSCDLPIDARQANDVRIRALLAKLRDEGWLAPTSGRQALRLQGKLRNLVLYNVSLQPVPQTWAQQLASALPRPFGRSSSSSPSHNNHNAARAWLALLSDKGSQALSYIDRLTSDVEPEHLKAVHPAALLLADAHGQRLLASWSADTQAHLLTNWLQDVNYYLLGGECAHTAWQQGLALLEQDATARINADMHAALGEQLLLQALWRGDFERLQQLGTCSPELHEYATFLLTLARGQVADALSAHARWLQRVFKRTRKRNTTPDVPLQTLSWLALLGNGNPELLRLFQKDLADEKDPSPGTLLFQLVNETLHGRTLQVHPDQMRELAKLAEPDGLDGLLAALSMYWLDQPPEDWLSKTRAAHKQWLKLGYDWLAAEYAAVLLRYEPEAPNTTPWHLEKGLQPLLALYQRQEPWQLALSALSRLRDIPGNAAASKQAEKRMAWLVGPDARGSIMIEPREQKCNAKGQWSKGRAVALQRLREQTKDFDYLTAQDRAVVDNIRREYIDNYYGYGNTRFYIPSQAALPHLVGHPYLYRLDAPEVRIDLKLGHASLVLQEKADQLHLHLEPEAIALNADGMIRRETPTLLTFYPPNPDVARVAEIIGHGLTVPTAARAQLIEAVSAIAPKLPVHSDIPELSGHFETIDGDSTLYAHLLPLDQGLRLQLLVRPQADGSWLRPGQGAVSLVGEQNGQPVQIRRNLIEERARLENLLAHCPALAQGEGDGQEWRFEAAQDALQLLTELHALNASQAQDGKADAVTCVWPEGERLRIRARPGMSSLRLSLKRQADWFALQGDITLDDGRVLQLKQLLDLLQASKDGRFVPLGEGDWLALSSDLRRRLNDVAHLAERIDDNGARLSPLSAPLLETLSEEAGEFSADAAWQEQVQRLQSLRTFTPKIPRLLAAELRDYQRDGFTWLARLAEWGVGACLADDMGLGKTVQLLALLLHRAKLGPQLVVAPTSVVANWHAEARRFAPSLQLIDYRQTRTLDGLDAGHLVLVSYGLLQNEQSAFGAQRWASVVLDEAQAVKNAQTKRSQAVMALSADFRVIASGTPLENHLGELWNLMRFLNPGLLGSQQRFAERFATPIENGDAHARRALKQLLQPFLLRRLKSEVLDELPARTDITHTVALSDAERHQYEALRQQAVEALANSDLSGGDARFKALAQITRLRRFCCHPSLVLPGSPLQSSKLQALQHIVEELRDNGHRALVFSQFVDHLAIVRGWLDGAGIPYQYLDGATPPKARSTAVAAFQAGEGDIFLISLKAGGSGLNLTAADYVIHLDPWWNPAVEDQASDRAHRIGQQRPVTVYRLVSEATIEEQIVALHAQKRDLADSLLEGGQTSAKLDAQALLALIRQA